ncbi:MAG: hypothetical protein AUG51_14355 [Acidobacteria bacterium 13_1_20CM_3_53_8]|nr:MAG: hypothetical protein AUG51_14355 [Acidobacteria bacterium 13_1_20CM_3_53_8]
MSLEWVRVTPEVVVAATAERVWLHQVKTFDPSDPFTQPMRGEGSFATTGHLLDGVICAAQRSITKVERTPPLTLYRWAWRLAGYYHTTHVTPRLMIEAAERFAAAGRTRLAQYAARKAQDEKRHDELALRDLQALGYQAELLVEHLIPSTAARLVEYFSSCVHAPDPAGCIGYSYALERLAVAVSKDYIEQVKAVLPPGVRATRCLRVHSAMGSDARHLGDAIEIIASLTASERERVALACYETTRICCSPPTDGYLSEEEIEHKLLTRMLVVSKKGVESCQTLKPQ